ncbi:MAG TPA: YtxH domain-containing protein [Longimicrobium sp.]|nr:YtxH domain-containing protein [Longimicrobium sp.]
MARQDNNDFLAAFAIGAVLGVGATLLLRPEKPNPRKQLQKRLKPHVRKLGRGARSRRRVRAAAPPPRERDRETGMQDDAIQAGRELLAEFRGEVQRILEEAREELRALAAEPGAAARPRDLPADVDG